MRSLFYTTFIFLLFLAFASCGTRDIVHYNLNWSSEDEVPAAPGKDLQPGLAGAVIGVSNEHLIIAGGANFPEGLPWRGGKRVYHNSIFAATMAEDGSLRWTICRDTLTSPIAYAANVPYKNSFISLGGENDRGLLNSVTFWNWIDASASLSAEKLPDLPVPTTNASAVILGEFLFLIGGENREEAFAQVWKLALNDPQNGWQPASPLPIAMSHTVAVAPLGDGGQFFVIGGRARQADGISKLYNTIFEYDLETETWTEKAKVPAGTSGQAALSAAMAVGHDGYIYLMGGDDGSIFHQIETVASRAKKAGSDAERSDWETKQFALAENHPGFSRQVYAYEVAKDRWTRLAPLPYAPVTSTAVIWNEEIFIPSGEIHPGVRTSNILRAPLKTLSE